MDKDAFRYYNLYAVLSRKITASSLAAMLGQDSEMPFGEGSSGVALEVNLEIGCLCSIIECEGDLHLPRPVLRGVSYLPCIMAAKSILQIIGQTDVMRNWISLTDKKVDVGEFHGRVSGRCGVHNGWLSPNSHTGGGNSRGMARPGVVRRWNGHSARLRCATPWQASSSTALRTKPGGEGSRTPVPGDVHTSDYMLIRPLDFGLQRRAGAVHPP